APSLATAAQWPNQGRTEGTQYVARDSYPTHRLHSVFVAKPPKNSTETSQKLQALLLVLHTHGCYPLLMTLKGGSLMSEKIIDQTANAPTGNTDSPLPPYRAFIVQFHTETDVAQGRIIGRIEHLVSGHASHFVALNELLAFVERVLTTKQE